MTIAFYIASFSALKQTHCTRDSKWVTVAFHSAFRIATEVVYLQRRFGCYVAAATRNCCRLGALSCSCWSPLFSAVFCSRVDTLQSCGTRLWINECRLYSWFLVSTEVMYLQRCLVVTWLVPRETAAISPHVLCARYSHAPVYRATSCKAT